MLFQTSINDVKIKISEWCKLHRQASGLSQKALADALGLSRITIRKLENGQNVTLDTLLKVVNHFDKLEALNQFLLNSISDANTKSLY